MAQPSRTSTNGVLADSARPTAFRSQRACSCSALDSRELRARFVAASRSQINSKSALPHGRQTMYTRPMILPLDSTGRIYVLEDEKGQVVGTGSREVCETLLYLMGAGLAPVTDQAQNLTRSNVRAAITI